MILRLIKIMLLAAVAAWALIGGLFNILLWGETLGSVSAATSMVTIEGGPEKWQAVSNPALSWLGAVFIAGSKIAAGVLIIRGILQMWGARNEPAEAFAEAKKMAIAGCGVAMFMLFAGFIVIAETWFELWRSDVMLDPVLGSAFRYAGLIGVIAIFVGQSND